MDKQKLLGFGVLAALVFFTVRHYTRSNELAIAAALPGI